jgi:Tol biopolymer transport system component
MAWISCFDDLPPPNSPPTVSFESPSPIKAHTLEAVSVDIKAVDPDGDTLTYLWGAVDGVLSDASGNHAVWIAPNTAGTYTITVQVSDGINAPVEVNMEFVVSVELIVDDTVDTATDLVFLSDRLGPYAVYSLNAASMSVSLVAVLPGTPFGPATLSPDGTQVVYASILDGVQGMFITEVGSTGPADLVISHENISIPVWSPEGETIAFSSHENDWEIYTIAATARNAAIGQARNVTNSPNHEYQPSWSPDGNDLLYVEGQAIYVHASDGSGTPLRIPIDSGLPENPAMSPDARSIAFALETDSWDIYVIDVATENVVNLTASASNDTSPAWSPDGAQIAFTSNRTGDAEIFIMRSDDGSGASNLTQSPLSVDASPTWRYNQ